MFAFEVGGLTLEVSPDDTSRIRLIAVTSGLLEARPHEIGASQRGGRPRGARAARYVSEPDVPKE